MGQYTSYLDFRRAYGSVKKEKLSNGLIEFGMSIKLVRPIKMFLK
jgi:hypothetical protein